ncbi:MAG TPA: aminoglycoside phosphotransferase family protein [Glycomyces sp.]|nr:aminoglycoside phosphotransferase family protein [Glycomyces sp.]
MTDEALVRSLLTDQHPDLAGLELRLVDGGWDNQMWRLGEDLAVRMPRTERAPALLEKELRWMSALAPGLPLPVPTPVRLGEPSERFPHTWIVTTWVAGVPADFSPIDRGVDAADKLAGFLSALHQTAPEDAPRSSDRGVPLSAVAGGIERRFDEMFPDDDAASLRKIWADALSAETWDGPPMWLHGDLHPANIVVAGGTLVGVIDFGDMCAGDPACDLAAAWLLLPAGADRPFFDAYVEADAATVRRARGWALWKSLGLIDIGHAGDMGWDGGKPTWKPAGEATIERLIASCESTGSTERSLRRAVG